MSGLSWKRFVDVLKAKERKTSNLAEGFKKTSQLLSVVEHKNELLEKESELLKEHISMLEGELAHVQAENADLRDEMEAMNAALNQPHYD